MNKMSILLLVLVLSAYQVPSLTNAIAETSTLQNVITPPSINKAVEAETTEVSAPTNQCLSDSRGNCGSDGANLDVSYTYRPETQDNEKTRQIVLQDSAPRYEQDKLSDQDLNKLRNSPKNHFASPDQDTLRQVVLIHRHGDRTPITFPPRDNIAKEPFWNFHGLGQLTNRGKHRLYVLGRLIRARYNQFLRGSVNKNFRKSRSSGALRCIESAQVFLSSFLALNTDGSKDAKALDWNEKSDRIELAELWQPASVVTLAAKFDGMLNEGAQCRSVDREYAQLDNSPAAQMINKEYRHEAEVIERITGFKMDHFYKWFWGGSVIEVERSYFEKKMNPELLKIYDRLQEASDLALVIYQSTLPSKRLRGGLLISDILQNMKQLRDAANSAGSQDQSQFQFAKRFVHYSGHDLTLVILLGMFDLMDKYPSRPDYASSLLLELHEEAGDWWVRMFYMAHVPMKPLEVHMERCESAHPKARCTLDKLDSLMEEYKIVSWMDWMRECNNTLDGYDPYTQNT